MERFKALDLPAVHRLYRALIKDALVAQVPAQAAAGGAGAGAGGSAAAAAAAAAAAMAAGGGSGGGAGGGEDALAAASAAAATTLDEVGVRIAKFHGMLVRPPGLGQGGGVVFYHREAVPLSPERLPAAPCAHSLLTRSSPPRTWN